MSKKLKYGVIVEGIGTCFKVNSMADKGAVLRDYNYYLASPDYELVAGEISSVITNDDPTNLHFPKLGLLYGDSIVETKYLDSIMPVAIGGGYYMYSIAEGFDDCTQVQEFPNLFNKGKVVANVEGLDYEGIFVCCPVDNGMKVCNYVFCFGGLTFSKG